MSEAFTKAGYEAPDHWVRRMMREAILEGLGIEARCLASFERRLPKSEDGLRFRALIGDELLRSAVLRLYHEIRNEIRREQSAGPKPSGDFIVSAVDGSQKASAAARPSLPQEEATAGPPTDAGRWTSAFPAASALPRQGHRDHTADDGGQPGRAPARQPYTPSGAMREVARQFMLNGRSIADYTLTDILSVQRKSGTEFHLARKLAELWPGHGKGAVRDFLSDREFEAIRAAAEAEAMQNAH
jgi:hypothetical protein